MKKLKDLTSEEIKKLYEKNQGFKDLILNYIYDEKNMLQGEEAENIKTDVFEYHNHYSSFYLATPCFYGVKDGHKVAHKLDEDYLNEENAAIYKELNATADIYENLDAEELDAQGEELEEKMNVLSDKLADGITRQLREYENITELGVDGALDFISDDMSPFSDFDTDGVKVYEYITKIYK